MLVISSIDPTQCLVFVFNNSMEVPGMFNDVDEPLFGIIISLLVLDAPVSTTNSSVKTLSLEAIESVISPKT